MFPLRNTPYKGRLLGVHGDPPDHQASDHDSRGSALGLRAGDQVEFSVEGSTVTLRKAEPRLSDDLVFRLVQAHAMRDWDTPEDDEAFRDL
jgi:hypothetical protein